MTKNYGDIMDKVEINAEMRERILINIKSDNYKTKKMSKLKSIYSIKDYLIIAACFMFLVGISISLPMSVDEQSSENVNATKQMTQIPNNIITFSSSEELSQSLGFEINDFDVPFEILSTEYISYFDELGQITYVGENQSLTYRKSLGDYDNSGDYTEYNDIFKITINNNDIIIKGNDSNYVLALWSNGEYSYSIRLLNPVTKEQINTLK